MSLTQSLIRAIETGEVAKPAQELVDHAAKNKVLLEFLRRVDVAGSLREREEERYAAVVRAAADVAEKLSGLNYALMKFAKPIAYVPADIDVLVAAEDAPRALERVEGLGYEVVVREPYCVTLAGSAIVDVYVHPCLANVPYMDGRKLLEHVREVELDGVRARALAPEAEVAVAAAHAVYKEQVFTLNDYFTVKSWLSPGAVRIARETRTDRALALAVSLVERVGRGELEAPHRIGVAPAALLLTSKLARDAAVRASAIRALAKLRDARLGAHLKSRLVRETY